MSLSPFLLLFKEKRYSICILKCQGNPVVEQKWAQVAMNYSLDLKSVVNHQDILRKIVVKPK